MSTTVSKNGATQTTKSIVIPEVRLERLWVVIEGQTPLITHRFGEAARKSIEDKQQGAAKTTRPPRDPQAEFKDSLYVIDAEAEKYGFPAAGIKKALVYAGGRFADEKMTELRGVINVYGDLLEIISPPPRMRSDTVKIDGGRTSSISYRPEFMPWEMVVPVVYNANNVTDSQVLNLFQLAGFSIGIGDWRPEKNGTFGQFTIKDVRGTA